MSWLFLSWSSHLEVTVYMCLSTLKQNMHFLCTNQFEASTFFLSPWTTHGNFTVFHALGVGNLNLAWVGWWGGGGIWTSGMRDFWFYNICWSHRELFKKNCAWLGHLNAILAHGGQEFQQTYLQKFKCPGGCLWEGCYSFKLIDALQSRLETCTIAVYPLLLQ